MSTVNRQAGVRTRRFSKREYYRLGELGFFHGQRVELIEGQVMVFSPQNADHASTIATLTALLPPLFGQEYHLRVQLPLDLGQTTEPEPDLSLVTGLPQDYRNSHPTTAALIIEVIDTTLVYDRRRKGSLYARAGILDYWIINLRRRQVEIYRVPIPDHTQRYGYRYSTRTDLQAGAVISPLVLPQVSLAVADLLA